MGLALHRFPPKQLFFVNQPKPTNFTPNRPKLAKKPKTRISFKWTPSLLAKTSKNNIKENMPRAYLMVTKQANYCSKGMVNSRIARGV